MTKFLEAPRSSNRQLADWIRDALRLVPEGELLDNMTASNACEVRGMWGGDPLLAVGVMTVSVETLVTCRVGAIRKHYELVMGPKLIFIYEELANV